MTQTIRILLADDHPLVRAGIRMALALEEKLTLVGEAVNGQQAQQLSRELNPDVLLLDLKMPGPPASETVAYLHHHCPPLKIIILTAYDDETQARPLLELGVAGYVLKHEPLPVLIRAIRAVMQGDTWFSQPLVARLVRRAAAPPAPAPRPELTQREQQILALMARGVDNPHIATELQLAPQTVRNYVSRIYARLGVRSRLEAVRWANRHQLL